MSTLAPCTACRRHVRVDDEKCPFCGTARVDAPASLAPRVYPRRVMAMIAAVSALSLGACDDEQSEESRRHPGVGSPTRELSKNQPLDAGEHGAEPKDRPSEPPVDEPVVNPVAEPVKRPVDVGTPVPPYGVAMPPPRGDVGTGGPAYGMPSPSPDGE